MHIILIESIDIYKSHSSGLLLVNRTAAILQYTAIYSTCLSPLENKKIQRVGILAIPRSEKRHIKLKLHTNGYNSLCMSATIFFWTNGFAILEAFTLCITGESIIARATLATSVHMYSNQLFEGIDMCSMRTIKNIRSNLLDTSSLRTYRPSLKHFFVPGQSSLSKH